MRGVYPFLSITTIESNMSQGATFIPAGLRGLTQEDVAFLDAVIDRAGPAATTFLPIFKAYSTILVERQIDAQESNYYAKLLKLGIIDGRDWGDKWELVQQAQE